MPDPGKAVFLSYASQDKEAAQRIAEALRAAGLEVWFDISELRGGDSWDAKIRKQIKECALFVPVISPTTNARAEGYFRLEWKLAVDRSHLLADDHPFLFPIVIGDVTDATARVPDKFREVQWTRLRLDETPAELAARIARLLAGDAPEDRGQRTGDRRVRGAGSRWSWWMIFPVIGGVMGMMFAVLPLWRAMQGPPLRSPAPKSETPDPPSQSPAPAPSEARVLARKAQALFEKIDSTADDYTAAEGLMQRALALDPSDGLILAIYSRLNTGFTMRGFDYSVARTEEARSQMERAMRLAPEEAEVWLARGSYLRRTNGSQKEAEVALRKALALDPKDTRPWFDLAWAVAGPGTDKDEEIFALLEKSIDPSRPGSDALAHYNQFNLRFGSRRFAEADALVRAAVSELPSANFVAGLARNEITWKGDAKSAVAVMDRLTPERAKEPRSVYTTAYVRLLAKNPTGALEALNRLTTDFITDSYYTGPKAYWIGRAHRQLGNAEAAKVAWESALEVSRREGVGRSGRGLVMQAELLALLGREAEALRTVAAYEQAVGSSGARRPPWVFSAARVYAALGRAAEALPLLETHFTETASLWPLTPALFRIDPTWDKIRDDPRIKELLARIEAAEIAAMPPRDWPKNPELKRAMVLAEGLETIPDDLTLAEQIVKPILERAPTDLEAVTVMARIQSHFMRRGFDRSDERSTQARLYCERALQLGPDEPEALYATATYLYSRVIDGPRAERLLRRAMELDPTNPRPGRLLADLYNVTNRPAEAIAQGQENVRRFPRDVLSHYDLARNYKDQGRYEEFDRELDATLAIAPLPNAIVWKARLQFGLHNDLAGMKAWLDRVPERVRGTERAVFSYFLYAGFGGDPESGLEALRGFPQKWFTDFEYAGPTALLNASLLELEGKKELARQQYEAALAEIQKMRVTDPGRIGLSSEEFWTLLGLGRLDEARTSHRRMIEGLRRPYAQYLVNGWWFSPIPGSLLLGERATALTLLRESLQNLPESRAAFRLRFQIDPRMAPFRDDPEITAILAEPAAAAPRTGDRGQEPARPPEAKP